MAPRGHQGHGDSLPHGVPASAAAGPFTSIPPGEHQARMKFAYGGGGGGKGSDVPLYLDGKQVGSGRVKGTHAMLF